MVQLRVMERLLNKSQDIEVVGTALNGVDALKLLPGLVPDVICTDYHMPFMDGLEFIGRALEIAPYPILVLSISVQPDQTATIFKLLTAGAIDVLAKPKITDGVISDEVGVLLIEKIKILNGVIPIRGGNESKEAPTFLSTKVTLASPAIFVIGSSTGGIQVLSEILGTLPDTFPVPIVCVQHISPGFLEGLTIWLQNSTTLKLVIAQEGQIPVAGHVYFAPVEKQLLIDSNGVFRLHTPSASGHICPSISQFFVSAALKFGSRAVGILLSGMGRSGVDGLKEIYESGGYTIAQDESTSLLFGMPKAAIDAGVVDAILPGYEIAPYMKFLCKI
jgi:two-component system chemotaxis response regulator CheB